jgi:hypothetical protein
VNILHPNEGFASNARKKCQLTLWSRPLRKSTDRRDSWIERRLRDSLLRALVLFGGITVAITGLEPGRIASAVMRSISGAAHQVAELRPAYTGQEPYLTHFMLNF